ncbi:MAG: endopeptidase La [Nitrospinae bacterium]|nr:endopeptidase La [Nitrospinota bacterium]
MNAKERFLKSRLPEVLPLLPLRDIVVFPGMVVPLFVGRGKSIAAVNHAVDNGKIIMLAVQKNPADESPEKSGLHEVGCVGEVMQLSELPDGTMKIMVEGLARATIYSYKSETPLFLVNARILSKITDPADPEIDALVKSNRLLFDKYVKAVGHLAPEVPSQIAEIKDPADIVNFIMRHVAAGAQERQNILAEPSVKRQLEGVYMTIEKEIEIIQIENRVKGRVKRQMGQSQREYYLNEQMKAIQKELGRGDQRSEMDELREKIKKAGMPPEVEAKAEKEVNKLEQMAPLSAEGTVVRNYLEWLTDVPWKAHSVEKLDTKLAQKVLDEDHFGLEKVKDRILDYLAVRKLSKTGRGPILCLVGAPGVGKTSLGKSIARAMGRKFVRVSLGGVRDEAEIRGHRRTYIGALPGRIIQSMKKAGTINPVLMLDEVDKMTADFRGDPSAALLEVLDPEQNKAFSDHYLEVDYDLSEVMFITTANTLHSIPAPLLDRMEVLRMSGYTEDEKIGIAQGFLIPKQMEEHGLQKDQLVFSRKALSFIIRGYTRESGVRSIERLIAKVCRRTARNVVEGVKFSPSVGDTVLKKMLGPVKFREEGAKAHGEFGFANGLAWTENGGEMMQIEVSVVPGKGRLILTGKLGEVMRESAQAALTYIRSRARLFSLPTKFYSRTDIHIHAPEGAIPKDGPSAGITMASAMVSAFCKTPVRHDVAMTGEITLRGKVLPIGGLKEKALAALRFGVKTVVIPKDNVGDLEEIPKNLLKEIKFVPVDSMDAVLDAVMSKSVFKGGSKVRVLKKKHSGPQLDSIGGIT